MEDLNEVRMTGRLTRDPETSFSQGGKAMTKFAIAVNRGKDKDGKDVEVDVSPADAFRKLYELRGKGVIKGLFAQQTLATDASRAGGDEPAAEYATQDEARDVATERAKAYAKEHGKDFSTSLRAVLDADPELKEAYAGVRPEGEVAAAAGAAKYTRIVAAGKPQ